MESYPPWLWGPPATGATAGAPGTYTPAKAKRPMDLADLGDVVADPLTAWAPGEYVPTRSGDAHWDGAAWAAGRAGAAVARLSAASGQLTAGPDGYGTAVKAADRPRSLEELAQRVTLQDPAPFPAGTSLPIGTRGKRAHWTGTEWKTGESPGYTPEPAPAGDDTTGAATGEVAAPVVDPAAPEDPGAVVTADGVEHVGVLPADAAVTPAETPDAQFPGDGGDTAEELHR